MTEDLSFSYAIRTHDVAGDVCQAPSDVVQSKAEFSVHVLDTPTSESWEHVVHVAGTNVSCVCSQYTYMRVYCVSSWYTCVCLVYLAGIGMCVSCV